MQNLLTKTNRKYIYFIIGLIILFLITKSFGFTPTYFIFYIIAAIVITSIMALLAELIIYCYKKSQGKKLPQILLTAFLALITVFIAQGASINVYKKGFYFEKYKTKEEAKEALLKLHPIGSDVDALVRTVQRAGAVSYNPYISEKYKDNPELQYVLWYKYSHRTINSFFPKEWDLTINFDSDRKIKNISMGFYQGE